MNTFRLRTRDREATPLPSGEGFPRTGMIGPWDADPLWTTPIYCELDLDQYAADIAAELVDEIAGLSNVSGDENLYYLKRPSRDGGKFLYYYPDRESAESLCKVLNDEEPGKYPWTPAQIWQFRAKTADVLSLTPEGREKWGEWVLPRDVGIKTLLARKYRHEFQLLGLPVFVAAYATAAGIDNPGFDISELLVPDDMLIINEQFQTMLIGNEKDGYEDSLLWKRRVALWAALGEDDPKLFHTKAADDNFSVTSDFLDNALQNVAKGFTDAWARVTTVPDPREDATYDDASGLARRLLLPMMTEIFTSEEVAKSVAEKELAERGVSEEQSKAATPTSIGGLKVPDVWAGMPDQWQAQVNDLRAKLPSGLITPVTVGALFEVGSASYIGFELKSLGATIEELMTWLRR